MEEKITAIYLMVRNDELRAEDKGSYDEPLERQKEECLKFLREKTDGKVEEPIEIYTRRGQLLMDIERGRIKRLVIRSMDRLGIGKEEVDGIAFELNMAGVELLSVE